MSKERPILFSSPMVRAILEGRKTQTRRVMKPQPPFSQKDVYVGLDGIIRWRSTGEKVERLGEKQCHYGQPGDRLWVRETWGVAVDANGRERVTYWADEGTRGWQGGKKKPSIHMPRWASRITLEVVSVRVERLLDIGEEDAKAEGASVMKHDDIGWHSHVRGFQSLWERINGPGSWDANPWVWVVEFKRTKP